MVVEYVLALGSTRPRPLYDLETVLAKSVFWVVQMVVHRTFMYSSLRGDSCSR
jgi:hypothetical protein